MSDASEESDHFNGLVQEHGESDNHSDAPGSQSDHDGDPDSDGGHRVISRDLLDMSAEEDDESEESDDGSERSDSDDSMDGYLNRMERSESPELHFFPQFKCLPIELRYHIWELFCPEILAERRVYPFLLRTLQDRVSGDFSSQIYPDIHLDLTTESSRAVLAVHKESREFALRAFPDALPFLKGTLRFNKEKDVVLLQHPLIVPNGVKVYPLEYATINQMRNVAISSFPMTHPEFPQRLWDNAPLLRFWENPGTVCVHYSADREDLTRRAWFVQKNHHYQVEAHEPGEYGVSKKVVYHYVWPNVDKHPRFMEDYIDSPDLSYNDWVESILVEPRFHSVSARYPDAVLFSQARDKLLPILQPMVEFLPPSSFRLSARLCQLTDGSDQGDRSSGDDEEDESEESDEYESSGIDDSDIEEHSENSSGEEDDLVVLDDDSGDEDGDGGASTFTVFSPLHEPDSSPVEARTFPSMVDLTQDGHGANFSGPEPDEDESQTIRGSDSEEKEEQEDVRGRRPRAGASRSRSNIIESDDEDVAMEEEDQASKPNKRKRVLDSDDEDEAVEVDEDEAPRKRSRTSHNQRDSALIVLPGDDSGEEIRKMRENARRSRAILVDDEDEDEDEEEEGGHRAQASSSEDRSEEEDEAAEAARPMSLMERLAIHRRDNPTPADSNDEKGEGEDPDIEEMGEDDYDARNYGDFEDDDERMDPDGDDGIDGEEGVDYHEGYDNEEEEEGGYY